jgi:hypothetical protein
MSVTDPAPFLKDLDVNFFLNYKKAPASTAHLPTEVKYVEPHVGLQASLAQPTAAPARNGGAEERSPESGKIESKIVVLEDFIDTDAVRFAILDLKPMVETDGRQLAPNEFLTTAKTEADFGAHVLEFTHPEFREKVKGGQTVVVAGKAFGCGSSRDVAVWALTGRSPRPWMSRA